MQNSDTKSQTTDRDQARLVVKYLSFHMELFLHSMRQKYGINPSEEGQMRIVINEFIEYLNSHLTDRSR